MGAVAVALSAAASLWLMFWPYFYQGVSSGPGSEEVVRSSASLIAINGYRVVPVLLAPVALAVAGLLATRTVNPRQPSGKIALWSPPAMLLLFCIVGSFSIGMFYIPAAAASLAAAISVQKQHKTHPHK